MTSTLFVRYIDSYSTLAFGEMVVLWEKRDSNKSKRERRRKKQNELGFIIHALSSNSIPFAWQRLFPWHLLHIFPINSTLMSGMEKVFPFFLDAKNSYTGFCKQWPFSATFIFRTDHKECHDKATYAMNGWKIELTTSSCLPLSLPLSVIHTFFGSLFNKLCLNSIF